jgi:hypothetical protein
MAHLVARRRLARPHVVLVVRRAQPSCRGRQRVAGGAARTVRLQGWAPAGFVRRGAGWGLLAQERVYLGAELDRVLEEETVAGVGVDAEPGVGEMIASRRVASSGRRGVTIGSP